MIKTEDTGPTSATTFDFSMDKNHRFSDSSTVVNTGRVQDSPSLPTALPENPTITFASSPSTPRVGRSLKPTMTPIPELQQLSTIDEIPLTQRRVNEKLESLPHQVLNHAYNVRSILGISGTANGDPLAKPSSAFEEREEITAQQRMVRVVSLSRTCSHGIADHLFDTRRIWLLNWRVSFR
jgi:hypothetical protein